jgi:hypothetical protein
MIVGGTASAASGGKFANGAVTAAFSYAFAEMARGSSPSGFNVRKSNEAGEYETAEPEGLAKLRARYPELDVKMDATMKKSTSGWLFVKEYGFLAYERVGGEGLKFIDLPEPEWVGFPAFSYGHIPFNGAPQIEGYELRVLFHTHPYVDCHGVRCGGSRQPYGPSPSDQFWAARYPAAFSVIQQLDRRIYYGPTAIPSYGRDR